MKMLEEDKKILKIIPHEWVVKVIKSYPGPTFSASINQKICKYCGKEGKVNSFGFARMLMPIEQLPDPSDFPEHCAKTAMAKALE